MKQILFHEIKLEELLDKISDLMDAKLTGNSKGKEDKSKYLSRSEVSKLLKISLPTLNTWTKLGWLQSYKIGNRVLYKQDEVIAAVEKISPNKHKKFR